MYFLNKFLFLTTSLIIVFCFNNFLSHNSFAQISSETNTVIKTKNFSKTYGNYLSSLSAESEYDFVSAAHYSIESLREDKNNVFLLKHSFKMLLKAGQFKRAAEISSKLEFYNDNNEFLNLWPAILLELKQNDFSTANELIEELNLEEYEQFFSIILRSWHFAIQDQKAKSISQIDYLINNIGAYENISLIQVEIQKLYILYFLKKFEELEVLINKILLDESKINPKYVVTFAQILFYLDKKDIAIQTLRKFLPRNYDLDLAVLYIKNNKTISPIQALSIALEDTSLIIANKRGWLQAFPVLRMASYLYDFNINSRLQITSILQSMKRYQEALNELNEIDDYYFYFPFILLEKSYLYEDLGKNEEAINILNELKSDHNYRRLAMIKLSNFYIRNKLYKEALMICDELLLDKKPDSEVFYYRALALVSLEKWDVAIDSLDILIKKIPNNPTVMNFVGYTYVDQNINLPEGLGLIEKAIQMDPNNGFFIDSLGWAYYRMGEYKKSVTFLEKSVELEPLEAEITDHLGDVYFKLNRVKEAILQWKKAISLTSSKEYETRINKKILENEIK
ncbi:MAG: hypothetical protein CMP38_06785 [Rickettsiales bacterium]|nr:hypothetical protein [Rickettsiales bacterium]